MLALLSVIFVALVWPHHTGESWPTGGNNAMEKRFNFFDAGPCIKLCNAECGGICFFNTRTFSHECNCAFKRSLG